MSTGGRRLALMPAPFLLLALLVPMLVSGPAYAAPAAPVITGPNPSSVSYYGSAFVTGTKEVGTVLDLARDSGRLIACDDADNPLIANWTCFIDPFEFFPRPPGVVEGEDTEQVDIIAVDVLGQRSPPAVVTFVFQPSVFAVRTPTKLPSGEVTTIEGIREEGDVGVSWTLEGPDGPVLREPVECSTGDVEGSEWVCELDTRLPARRAARVPDGVYTATIREFIENDGPVEIDRIDFEFTVGDPPPDPPPGPAPSAPTAQPAPPAPGGVSGQPGTAAPGPGAPVAAPAGSPAGTPAETPAETPAGPLGEAPTETPTDGATDSPAETPAASPGEAPVEAAAAPPVAVDILPLLLLAVLVFTVLGLLGTPGVALGGRFAAGSTRTGGGHMLSGRARGLGVLGLAAGEVGAADEGVGTEVEERPRWGDRSLTWRAPGHRVLDHLAATLPATLAPRWPLLARVLDDGTPVRAVLGSLSLLLPAAGLVLGVAAGLEAGGPYAPVLVLSAVLLAIGLLDALAGVVAVTGFTVVVLASGLTSDGLTLAQGLRGLIGVAALWFVVPLVAGSARPFRRVRAAGQVYGWDRTADAVIAALVSGWAVQGLVSSLDDLVGRAQPLTPYADRVALLTMALVGLRFGLEELAARAYPLRVATVHPAQEPAEPSVPVQLRAVVVRSGFLAFFAWAFIDSCWQLWVGVAIFALPYVLAVVHEQIPDAKPLRLVVPRGVLGTLVLLLVGVALAYWIEARAGTDTTEALRDGFVILSVPASAVAVLGVLGGEPPEPRWTWPRQLGGAVVVALTVVAVLVWG